VNLTGWLALAFFLVGVVGQYYFRLGRHVEGKRRYFLPWLIVTGAIFMLLPATDLPWWAMLLWGPLVGWITWSWYRYTKFCSACGAMCNTYDSIVCPRCGMSIINGNA